MSQETRITRAIKDILLILVIILNLYIIIRIIYDYQVLSRNEIKYKYAGIGLRFLGFNENDIRFMIDL